MKNNSQSGQALIEALVVSGLWIAMVSLTLLLFAYGTLQSQVELEMHEALVCTLSENPPHNRTEIRNLCLLHFKKQLSVLLQGAELLEARWVMGRDSARMTTKIRFLKHSFTLNKRIRLPLKKSS